jgi:hypothetical protein
MSLLVPEHRGTRFYFDPAMYSPEKGFKDHTWKNLKSDIQRAARNSGYELQSNGGGDNYRKLHCVRGVLYKPPANTVEGVYRQPKMHNDKRNTRGPDGGAMPRNTTTRKVVEHEKERKCTMRFCLYVYTKGFYFAHKHKDSSACREHRFHQRLAKGELPPKSRLIPHEARKLIGHVEQACVSNAANANIHMTRYPDEFITDSQIRTTLEMSRCAKEQVDKDIAEQPGESSADRLLKFLRHKKCKHILLAHRKYRDGQPIIDKPQGEMVSELRQPEPASQGVGTDGGDGDRMFSLCPVSESEDLYNYTLQHRESLLLEDRESDLLINPVVLEAVC